MLLLCVCLPVLTMVCLYLVLCSVIRKLLGDERFLNFVKENPQVKFSTELKGARHPVLIGDYSEYSAVMNAMTICILLPSNIAICVIMFAFLQSLMTRRSAM